MNESEAIRSGELKGEDAPRLLEHPERPIGTRRLNALLQVDLVEAQGGNARLRRLESDVCLELLDGRQVGQSGRVMYQMPERDERMGLAPSVVDREFPIRLVALAGQTQSYVSDQGAQVIGRIGQGKEFGRMLVDRSLAFLHDHVVQVSGKYGQREFTRLQVIAQLHDLVPGFGSGFGCHVVPIDSVTCRAFLRRRIYPYRLSRPDFGYQSFDFGHQHHQILERLAGSTQDCNSDIELLEWLLVREVIIHRYKNVKIFLGGAQQSAVLEAFPATILYCFDLNFRLEVKPESDRNILVKKHSHPVLLSDPILGKKDRDKTPAASARPWDNPGEIPR